ncbi:MAG: hypothetical protein RIQ81_1796 [Pseudomonadota bacterium]
MPEVSGPDVPAISSKPQKPCPAGLSGDVSGAVRVPEADPAAGRFRASMELFQFCRMVLGLRRPGVRIMDQHVGELLELDPAECTHWKKGRKQIRSLNALRALAAKLSVQEWIVAAVISGDMDAEEGVCEVKGYGPFELDPTVVEAAIESLRQAHPGQWTAERELLARQHCRINRPAIVDKVRAVHQASGFESPPFYLPELRNQRPYVRFDSARGMAPGLLKDIANPGRSSLPLPLNDHLAAVEANVFALELLAPLSLVRREIAASDPAHDLAARLAETFWLSRNLMNRRIKDALLPAG